MVETPELRVDDRIVLRPATNAVLVAMFEAYQEDVEAAQTALPWLTRTMTCVVNCDMLYDIEAQGGTDTLHFWSIHTHNTNEFVGLVGLGDELNPCTPTSTSATGSCVTDNNPLLHLC